VQVRRVRIVSLAIVLVGTALAVTACRSGGAPQPSPSPSLTLSAPSPSPVDSAVAAVQAAVGAYQNMWVAYNTAVQVPDPNDPNLVKYASGTALKNLVNGLQSIKSQGLKGTGSVVTNPKVTAVSPTSAPTDVSLSDCLDTSGTHIVRAGPGPAYSDSPGGRRLTTATVQRQSDGSWKVTDFGIRGVGTCG
jgi:hypothetical protein